MGTESYNEGYYDALNEVQTVLNNSIKRNGLDYSGEHALNVVNDVITCVHNASLNKKDEEVVFVLKFTQDEGGILQ